MQRSLISLLTTIAISTSLYAQPHTNVNQYYQSIRHNPARLNAFLYQMPKGGDLHNHHGGASFAENMLSYAKNDPLCLDEATLGLTDQDICPTKDKLQNVLKDPTTVDKIIDAWSMRNFHAGTETGHDHFFNTFGKYLLISSRHSAEILTELVDRAGQQNETYLEIMMTPDGNMSGHLGSLMQWPQPLPQLRQQLLYAGLRDIVHGISTSLDHDETYLKSTLHCDSATAAPGCQVKVRYLYQVLREQQPTAVFAQLLAGFEAASQDPRIVGINMVQAEDGPISMRDYELHMQMVGFLHALYPAVHITLHAGELIPGLVPEEGLQFHIRDAVNVAQAERIGHGADINHETQAETLLHDMAQRHLPVEISFSSSAQILGLSGKNHPFAIYQQANVPITLATDDEGVNRANLTTQYLLAAMTFKLPYTTLKQLSRNGVMYAFLPGHALWNDFDYQDVVFACKNDTLGTDKPSAACQQFLQQNEKAATQWELEKRFIAFENRF